MTEEKGKRRDFKGKSNGKISIEKEDIPFIGGSERPSKITTIQFTMFDKTQMNRIGEFEVNQPNLFVIGSRQPNPDGVLDRRLGVCDSVNTCKTCGKNVDECCGHFGEINLALPVFHIGFFRPIIQVLQCVCKNCNRLLLTDEEREYYLKRMRNKTTDTIQRTMLVRALIVQCRKHYNGCPHCNAINGSVRKYGNIKLVHDKYHKDPNLNEMNEFYDGFDESIKMDKEIGAFLGNAQEDLDPLRVLNIFKSLVREDIEAMDFSPDAPPEKLILTSVPVPPLTIRPSVSMDGGNASNEDDLTTQLKEVVECNTKIIALMEKGYSPYQFYEAWDQLTVAVSLIINSDLPMCEEKGKPLRSLCQRLKGKHGRFRGNLLGKRVDFSGRTVISPDPNLDVEQLGVPQLMAITLTYPERVTRYNIEKMRQLVRNGPDTYPGCNGIIMIDGNRRSMMIKPEMREKFAKELRIGEIVERHLEDGDIVLFNRQPSLHRISIMCHIAKVLPWRTMRFNECVCTPYNADFDGDEMNLHVPQTEEARAECLMLMHSAKNLQTPRTGQMIIAETQDFLTVSFLLTAKDFVVTEEEMMLWSCWFHNAGVEIRLPTPAYLKPKKLWTGKQLYGLALRPNPNFGVDICLDAPSKNYSKEGKWMCMKDGWICFKHSQLVCGQIDKAIIGSGNKSGLFHLILRDYGLLDSAKMMAHISRFCARFLGDYGFSIGISDVTPSLSLTRMKEELVGEGYAKCDQFIKSYNDGKQEIQPGSTPEQTLEALLNSELSQVRERAGKRCIDELRCDNSPLVMALCGSKGSVINISQMIACVGQQTVNGGRVSDGFISRSLPHFPLHSRTPQAKGFVKNSFFTGLNATEFFFHTMGGREGLVDSAVKTAETGYMQRRLMKALEDLHVHYDGTVRSAGMTVIEFKYGDDGLDPLKVECDIDPINYESVLANLQQHQKTEDLYITPKTFDSYYKEALTGVQIVTDLWKSQLDVFMEKKKSEMSEVYTHYSEKSVRDGLCGITVDTMKKFVKVCEQKGLRNICEPGTPVGALAGQSMGEPSTQMVLKTFHFAGVASMNIALGVPRIKEIINASKKIQTPIVTAKLVNSKDVTSARIVKGRIEATKLKEIAKSVKIVFKPAEAYVSIKLDFETIKQLQLECSAEKVHDILLNTRGLKLKEKQVLVRNVDKLRVYVDKVNTSLLFSLNALRNQLLEIIVCGIEGTGRAVINKSKIGFELLVEGSELLKVMGVAGVIGESTTCNHIMVVEKVLGIEAARSTIISEIKNVMDAYGLSIDIRHLLLLSDLMTFKGVILGITRYGISKMKDSVFTFASFERTNDHLFDAAVHSRQNDIAGVSESIIVGNQVGLGTGLMSIMYDPPKPIVFYKKYDPLF
ncbi:DNA-directed RNA polymerase III subunit RPC1, putative [Entamoeba invadens IP1]|uniref:DNA-directed RNA polymerase subunit n=1 Tax=Entamoeba invadens IP1 TaxID=370355 RepID=A0A0A1U5A2_ENTIV|nr:DNA-directed RNA polymerase III subunit RPC1, putative [Entamoeba invadens IP1]ELP89407.1 DNA-directed RNA polymerase III subunit RPC1, putative [Entamoeba invadens IP1]|eukprot:XP_004256178.1 DNA-directed RNA polymerase III subunit RPC1, putative [Entamoeba invadens IP1]